MELKYDRTELSVTYLMYLIFEASHKSNFIAKGSCSQQFVVVKSSLVSRDI